MATTTDPNQIQAIAQYTNFRGETITYGLSSYGQVISSKDSQGKTRTSTRNPKGLVTVETDELLNQVTYDYDLYNNLTQRTDAIGTETWVYQPALDDRLISHTDGVGRTTTYDIDKNNGDVLSITVDDANAPAGSPKQTMTSYTYYSNGLLHTSTDALGHITSDDYDADGRLITVTNPGGTTRTQEYGKGDMTGNIRAFVDESKHRTEIDYDPMNRPTERRVYSVDDTGKNTYTWVNKYDAAGNLIFQQDSNNHITTSAYDNLDRLIKRVDGAGDLDLVTQYAYEPGTKGFIPKYPVPNEPLGFYRFEINPLGFISVQISNKYGQTRYSIDQLGQTTETHYDAARRVDYVILPNVGGLTIRLMLGAGLPIKQARRWRKPIPITTPQTGSSGKRFTITSVPTK